MFKGHGYEELAEAWGLTIGNDEETVKIIVEEMLSSEKKDEKARDLREFLKTLAKEEEAIGYRASLWRGLREISDDGDLLNVASRLVDLMWT